MLAYVGGDRAAFKELFERYAPKLEASCCANSTRARTRTIGAVAAKVRAHRGYLRLRKLLGALCRGLCAASDLLLFVRLTSRAAASRCLVGDRAQRSPVALGSRGSRGHFRPRRKRHACAPLRQHRASPSHVASWPRRRRARRRAPTRVRRRTRSLAAGFPPQDRVSTLVVLGNGQEYPRSGSDAQLEVDEHGTTHAFDVVVQHGADRGSRGRGPGTVVRNGDDRGLAV